MIATSLLKLAHTHTQTVSDKQSYWLFAEHGRGGVVEKRDLGESQSTQQPLVLVMTSATENLSRPGPVSSFYLNSLTSVI